jgi:hypothetical protein
MLGQVGQVLKMEIEDGKKTVHLLYHTHSLVLIFIIDTIAYT